MVNFFRDIDTAPSFVVLGNRLLKDLHYLECSSYLLAAHLAQRSLAFRLLGIDSRISIFFVFVFMLLGL